MKNKSVNHLLKSIALLLTMISLSACQTGNLSYQVNPDLSPIQALRSQAQIIAISVVDKRNPGLSNPQIQSETDLAAALEKQLRQQATESGLKLIADPLLADMALTLEIERFSVTENKGTFSSQLEVKSYLNLILQKKSRRISKRFISKRTQEVALPVENTDVTGIVNQILSEQLSRAFADPEISKFIEQPTDSY